MTVERTARGTRALIGGTYALAAFVGAMLLFVLQPMVGKMLLPQLGGAPSVWSTCLVFFQVLLVGGYGYAHALAQLPRRSQPVVHFGLMVAAMALLPISFQLGALDVEAPVSSLLFALFISVGLPFGIVSATAPIVQSWFAGSGHPGGADPYPLYAASNAGSLLGLLAYPFVVEPWLLLSQQAQAWTWGYAVLIATLAAPAALAWLRSPRGATHDETKPKITRPLEGRRVAGWVLLAALPSALMVASTTTITTDIAAVPLLWIAPLATFLIAYMVGFARTPWLKTAWVRASFPVVAVVLVSVLVLRPRASAPTLVGVHMIGLLVIALLVVTELVRRRPTAEHLTAFYLAISVGGALGGAAVTFGAPLLFVDTWEYPLVVAIALLVVGWTSETAWRSFYRSRKAAFLAAVAAGVGHGWVVALRTSSAPTLAVMLAPMVAVVAALVLYVLLQSRRRFAVGLTIVLAVGVSAASIHNRPVFAARSFFAAHRVVVEPDQGLTVLYHGQTNHGAQSSNPRLRRWSLPYHHPTSPAAELFADVHRRLGPASPVAVAGLGVGGLACLAAAGEPITFYEVDPLVAKIATDPRLFDFMSRCDGRPQVILGDARVMLRTAPASSFGLIILDAFSSGSIPVHLVTVDAAAEYLDRLRPHGLLAFHVSNHFVDIRPMLTAVARRLELAVRVRTSRAEVREGVKLAPTAWVVMARHEADVEGLEGQGWRQPAEANSVPWTDHYSNLVGALGDTTDGR